MTTEPASGVARFRALRVTSSTPVSRHMVVVLSVIGGLVLATLFLPKVVVPRLSVFGPIQYMGAVLACIGTSLVSFSMWHLSRKRRAKFVLAVLYAANTVLMLLAMLTLQLMPGAAPILPAPAQAGIWFYVGWHVVAAVGALIYLAVRASDDGQQPSTHFMRTVVACAAVAIGAIALVAMLENSRLPTLIGPVYFTGLLTSGVGPGVSLLLAAATIVAFAQRGRTRIDGALALALLALTLDMTLLYIGIHRFTLAFYAGRALLLLGAAIVLVASLETQAAAWIRMQQSSWKLARVEGESEKRAGRIRALWEITSNAALSQQERFDAVLETATAAIRPGKAMCGTLLHLDGDTIVIDAMSLSASDPAADRYQGLVYPGASFPLEQTMQRFIHAQGRTLAWGDLRAIADSKGTMCERSDSRSLIGTPIAIGRKNYFLSFASPETMLDEPFAEDDAAYIEVVGAVFASRFAQSEQFERIQFQMEHDALTGLENRIQFRKAIRMEIAAGNPFAIALLNLDGFRRINERHGHQLGDEVLVEVASELRGIDDRDLVARMSGDEFGIVLRGVSSPEIAEATLEQYTARFREPFHTGDRMGTQLLRVGASLGATCYPEHGKTPEELLLRADAALGFAKDHGGSATVVFDAAMEATLQATKLRLVELADAIAGDELALVYQPSFSLATREVIGAEALVRWDHPIFGRLMPADFIALAERNELIVPLTRWVLERLLRDLENAPELPETFRVYFNLSARTLNDVPFIAGMLERLAKVPHLIPHLGVEVTESAAIDNVESATQTLERLRAHGLTVAVDDFGTGYSSLSYLKKLAVDVIKIDRSFVIGLPGDAADAAIADMLLRITDAFDLTTLAEGIETEDQAAWLLAHGCRNGQGYLVAKPGSFEELLTRLESASAAA